MRARKGGYRDWAGFLVACARSASVPEVATLPLPHMGWNDVFPEGVVADCFQALESDARFYFLHSYFFECAEPAYAAATASYGIDFACAVRDGNVHGVQFHPEKSHHWGSDRC